MTENNLNDLLVCPFCKTLMYRKNWGTHSGVIVDKCASHGQWYDQGEVEKIREYVKLGGVELEKLRLTEDGLSKLHSKLAHEVARLDLKNDSTYRRARLYSLIGL